MELLKGKVAVVSGAARPEGIGRAVGELFMEQGARVAILDIDGQGVAQTAHEMDQTGQFVRAYQCDVGSAADCIRAIDSIKRWTEGVIDILVNNAGVTQKSAFLDVSESDFDRLQRVNLKSVFLLSQAVMPTMMAAQSGSIVCISSLSAQNGGGIFGASHYCASKAGVLGLVRAMAKELGPHGIRVNAIAPGLMTTDFSRTGRTAQEKDDFAKGWPLGRAGRPHEVAGGCLFLASHLSSYVTGTTLDINGGAYMN